MKNNALTMEISSHEGGAEIAVLRIAGALDFSGIAMLSNFFDKITAENRSYVVVDLAGIEAICSAALGEFMGYRKRFVERGGSLVFAGLSGNIRSKLTLLGANKIFSFYQDVRGAINAYKWDYKKQSKSLTVAFPASLKLVPPVRQLAARLARQKGYSVKDAFRIETIVDEVCNNAVEHGLHGQENLVEMRVAIDKEKVDISVSNRSDPGKVAALKELIKPVTQGGGTHVGHNDKRGRGLALIRMLSNDMDVNITEHGTSVHVIKLREE
ncbi:MAG: ATP-binding protein [Chitinispirillales bacterium]|jgi:anti-anti-sigma factor|nr:ATP-binding protein [Chitinispirillales bacterium]